MAATAAAQTATPVPTDAEIRRILVERIDAQRQSVGIVVGVIEASGRRIVSYGRLAKDEARTPDGDTIFEIGSITKVFTSLLLADAVQRGEVSLADPVRQYLPEVKDFPQRGDHGITLEDLATHTSGMPRIPQNLISKLMADSKAQSDPYSQY